MLRLVLLLIGTDGILCGTYGIDVDGERHNQRLEFTNAGLDKKCFIALTFDAQNPDNGTIKESFYYGTEQLTLETKDGILQDEYYKRFVSEAKNNKFIEIGRCNYRVFRGWRYLKGKCYCATIYNRGLSNDEIENIFEQMKLLYT